jgi:4-aminobutyrate aminotransferase-like enzyme
VGAKITRDANPKLQLGARLMELGMMAMCANPGNVVGLAPPLIVGKSEIDEGIQILDQALEITDAAARA